MSRNKTWVIVKLKRAKNSSQVRLGKVDIVKQKITKLDFTKCKTTYQNNTMKKVKTYI